MLVCSALVTGLIIISKISKDGRADTPSHYYPFNDQRFSEKNQAGIIEIVKDNANKDSNGDGIIDKDALEKGLDPYMTDTDGDGIFDVDEIKITKTDPLKKDTDGDGYNDLEEIRNGFNPNGPGKLEIKK